MARVTCKDCLSEGITTVRKPALTRAGNPVPGKRCVTHERARKQSLRGSARARRLLETYAITLEEYDRIKAYQHGTCAICQRATGAYKALAVDHDHDTGLVRGLLCSTCNKILGHFRDDPDAFQRGMNYLDDPPAEAVIGYRIAPIELDNLTRNAKGEAA